MRQINNFLELAEYKYAMQNSILLLLAICFLSNTAAARNPNATEVYIHRQRMIDRAAIGYYGYRSRTKYHVSEKQFYNRWLPSSIARVKDIKADYYNNDGTPGWYSWRAVLDRRIHSDNTYYGPYFFSDEFYAQESKRPSAFDRPFNFARDAYFLTDRPVLKTPPSLQELEESSETINNERQLASEAKSKNIKKNYKYNYKPSSFRMKGKDIKRKLVPGTADIEIKRPY